jgi:hypothetical protein
LDSPDHLLIQYVSSWYSLGYNYCTHEVHWGWLNLRNQIGWITRWLKKLLPDYKHGHQGQNYDDRKIKENSPTTHVASIFGACSKFGFFSNLDIDQTKKWSWL